MNAEGNCCEQSFAKIKRFFGGWFWRVMFTGRRNQTNYERIVYIYEKFMRRKDFLVCGFGGCKALWKELPLLHRIAFLGRSICALGRRSFFQKRNMSAQKELLLSYYNNIVPPRPRSRYNSFFSCFTAAQHTLGNQQNNIILLAQPTFFPPFSRLFLKLSDNFSVDNLYCVIYQSQAADTPQEKMLKIVN